MTVEIKRLHKVRIIEKEILSFTEWKICYGACSECAVDIIRVDRNSWLDDFCHRHQFETLIESEFSVETQSIHRMRYDVS